MVHDDSHANAAGARFLSIFRKSGYRFSVRKCDQSVIKK